MLTNGTWYCTKFPKKIELQSKFLKYDQPHDLRDVPNSLKLISQLSAVPVYKVLVNSKITSLQILTETPASSLLNIQQFLKICDKDYCFHNSVTYESHDFLTCMWPGGSHMLFSIEMHHSFLTISIFGMSVMIRIVRIVPSFMYTYMCMYKTCIVLLCTKLVTIAQCVDNNAKYMHNYNIIHACIGSGYS